MSKKIQKTSKNIKDDIGQPLMVASASNNYESIASSQDSSTGTRRNAASTITRTDRYKNIDDGLIPFKYSLGIKNSSNMNVRDAVILCQKAYYNFSIFRNTIDLITEFSTSNIFFRNGSRKSRDFFSALFRKINVHELQDKFFREYYRSGNVFLYRFDNKIKEEDAQKITQTFGAISNASIDLPVK